MIPSHAASLLNSTSSTPTPPTDEAQTDLAFRGTLGREAEFVLLSARTQLRGTRRKRWEKLLKAGDAALDWEIVFQLATAHRVLGLLGSHLGARNWQDVPPAIKAGLQNYFVHVMRHSNALKHELALVSHLLEAAGIPVVSFKGQTLGLTAYGNAVVRTGADLDLLVRRSDVLRARDLLATAGYALEVDLPVEQEAQVLHQDSVFNLFRPTEPALRDLFEQGYPVELHWAITSPCLPFDLDYETLAPRLEWLELPGVKAHELTNGAATTVAQRAAQRDANELFLVRALAPEDLLLILCVHGTKHLWERLIWICDLAELIQKTPDLDWSRFLRSARERGVQRMAALGLSLVRTSLGTPLPGEVETWLSTQPEALRISSRLRRQLLVTKPGNAIGDSSPGHDPAGDMLLLQAIDTRRHRIAFLWHLATVPTLNDRATLNLPPKWDFLWWGIRLTRSIGKRLKIKGRN